MCESVGKTEDYSRRHQSFFNTNNALEESSFEENKDDNTKENSLKKGRYCIVDMTSSDDIADLYHVFLALGVHVVTQPLNKKCNSRPTK